ncbi:MAG TPA: D-glycero-beta-D-manno-heptose-7-phosphate kinase [Vicinamibacterales bacterium]|jgi:D-beta-D-heptose 7-phosphate kinase/D-beta-D-heptose 1-phosphate adenosyltransferase|nr:D-glycero-beta-D-manno-heptose-7-phosphate kinase [Vicinamibacterales bacterium]
MTSHRAGELIARFPRIPILVVGDLMIDRFIVGRVERISPEAPVPVVRFQSEHSRLGGAANVAHNLAALDADVSLVGVVGGDAAADRLKAELERAHIRTNGLVVDGSRPTVEKVRIVTERNQQVARIDYERDEDVTAAIETEIVSRIQSLAAGAKALVVSDYLKGAVTRNVVAALAAERARQANAPPLLVDPKIPHLDCYGGASLVTPNHYEAETATHRRIRTDEDAREAAVDFRALTRCEAVVITRGEHGMWLSSRDAECAIPAATREVSDVTGAGDTVAAVLALAIAAGATLVEAALLANQAASLVVGKFGPATVGRGELLKSLNATAEI